MSTEARKVNAGGDLIRRQTDTINQHADLLNTGLLQNRTVAQLADEPHEAGRNFFCTNESGGAVPVFSDGAAWRRYTDRAVAS